MNDDDRVFKALADPSRRRLLDILFVEDGLTLNDLCGHLAMTRQAVSQHLAVLEGANLVVTSWQGREKHHSINAVPIHRIQERWIAKFEHGRLDALSSLKQRLEGTES